MTATFVHEQKIELSDSLIDVFHKLAEGNPGAISALATFYNNALKIDPDIHHPMMGLLHFDSVGLYGPKIWALYKDICGERIDKMWACIRAVQLGILSKDELLSNVWGHSDTLNVNNICDQVKIRLPKFVCP